MRISTELIKSFNPCQDRLDNWLKHYSNFNGNLKQFFKLKHITHSDKLWVALRVASNDIKVIFAIDCSLSAIYAYAADAADAYAAADIYAAYYAAYAANADAAAARYAADAARYSTIDREVEEQRQLTSLLYLIERE